MKERDLAANALSAINDAMRAVLALAAAHQPPLVNVQGQMSEEYSRLSVQLPNPTIGRSLSLSFRSLSERERYIKREIRSSFIR